MEPIKKLIMQAASQISKERAEQAQALGITGIQMSVIDFMANHDYQVSQQAIEQEFDIRRSTTTIMIQRMANHGLVEHIDDPNDKRRKKVRLTPKAIRLIKPIKACIVADDQRVRQHFSDDTLTIVAQVLTEIQKGV